ncbi:hypothetical protein [Bacillus testis]|uniref:hypothetical protein n=1 Tax=Bacillus testis TaxID=1622072 RepID=UPI00067F62BD|nr:hypothetical protein [Bacillus testis]
MKLSNSFPYPVLRTDNDDYINSSFHVAYDVVNSFGELRIKAEFELDNEGIVGLITSGVAKYMLHIEGQQTSFRKLYKSHSGRMEVSIPTDQLRGKVAVHSFVVADRPLHNYTNNKLNDWYKGVAIHFEKGNFLAIGEAIEMNLFEDHTEFLDLPSIVNIQKAVEGEFMEVDIHSNHIVISLPAFEYGQYAVNANSRLKQTILTMVIVPALTEVFSKIKENGDDLEEYTWYQVMGKIFEENGYRLEDVGTERLSSLKAAQLVLRKPLKLSFEEIDKMNKVED